MGALTKMPSQLAVHLMLLSSIFFMQIMSTIMQGELSEEEQTVQRLLSTYAKSAANKQNMMRIYKRSSFEDYKNNLNIIKSLGYMLGSGLSRPKLRTYLEK